MGILDLKVGFKHGIEAESHTYMEKDQRTLPLCCKYAWYLSWRG